MLNKILSLILFIFLISVYPACAKKPVVYPNDHSKTVGKIQTDQDIEYCLKLADDSIGKTSRGKTSVKSGVKGGLIGGAIGLGIGIVTGSPGTAALQEPLEVLPEEPWAGLFKTTLTQHIEILLKSA